MRSILDIIVGPFRLSTTLAPKKITFFLFSSQFFSSKKLCMKGCVVYKVLILFFCESRLISTVPGSCIERRFSVSTGGRDNYQ